MGKGHNKSGKSCPGILKSQNHLLTAQERWKGYICLTLELVGLSTFNGEITPTSVRACFMSRKLILNGNNANFRCDDDDNNNNKNKVNKTWNVIIIRKIQYFAIKI